MSESPINVDSVNHVPPMLDKRPGFIFVHDRNKDNNNGTRHRLNGDQPFVTPVPFLKRPFEWGVCGGTNLATFWCVLRVIWCHGVRFSCYLCQDAATMNVSKFRV